MKHADYDFIKAFIDGEKVQYRYSGHDWEDVQWLCTFDDGDDKPDEFRIKPKESVMTDYDFVKSFIKGEKVQIIKNENCNAIVIKFTDKDVIFTFNKSGELTETKVFKL